MKRKLTRKRRRSAKLARLYQQLSKLRRTKPNAGLADVLKLTGTKLVF